MKRLDDDAHEKMEAYFIGFAGLVVFGIIIVIAFAIAPYLAPFFE